jgi:phosphoenolpyruvate carboxykinase (ATP)
MQILGLPSEYGIENHGLVNLRTIYANLSQAALVEQILQRNEGILSSDGAVIVSTGQYTGRSPNDKYVVQYPADTIPIWWGKINQPLKAENANSLYQKITAYLQGRDVFVQDVRVCAHPDYSMPIRVVTENAWAALFANDLFIRLSPEQIKAHVPEFTVLHCPNFYADPTSDGTKTGTFIVLDFQRKMVLIGGTSYAGEIKKSIFSVLNLLLPLQGVLSMHCSANVGEKGDVALFFGLSGTGKTTLSSAPDRQLIGDDEHGWSDSSVFNIEGGCYAKTIKLRLDLEPIIWAATHRFGTVLENVVFDPSTRVPDFDSDRLTENTRAAYPIYYVPNHVKAGHAGHPENIYFLTADAFGILPPLAKLTPDQAMYYFLSGYTSKLAGTEKGLGTEPQATFSTCFGSPFLPLHPRVYAELLGKKIEKHRASVWLVNTGWTGGPYGIGQRIRLPFTRAMIRASLARELDHVEYRIDPIFGFQVPRSCPGVPPEVLDPQSTWHNSDAYTAAAKQLAARFHQNFEQYCADLSSEIVNAGPIPN